MIRKRKRHMTVNQLIDKLTELQEVGMGDTGVNMWSPDAGYVDITDVDLDKDDEVVLS